MIRTVLATVFLAVSAGGLAAEEPKREPPSERPAGTVEEGGTPLESIGEEAAEVGAMEVDDGDDGMSREVGEMIRSEDTDGCEGSMAENCGPDSD